MRLQGERSSDILLKCTSHKMAGSSDSEVSADAVAFSHAGQRPQRTLMACVNQPCSQCRQPMSSVDEMSAKLGVTKVCHKKCYNAVKALQRLAAPDPELASKLRKVNRQHPERYAALAQTLVTDSNHSRTPEQKRECKEFVYEIVAETSSRRRKRLALMTRRQYLAYYVWQELMTFEEAEAKWTKDVKDSKIYKEGSGSSLKIAVRKADELITEEGMVKRRKLQDRSEVSDDEADCKLSNIMNVRHKLSEPEFQNHNLPWIQGGSSCKSEPMPKAPSLAGLTGVFARGDAESEGSIPGSVTKPKRSVGKSHSDLGGDDDKDDDDDDDDEKVENSEAASHHRPSHHYGFSTGPLNCIFTKMLNPFAFCFLYLLCPPPPPSCQGSWSQDSKVCSSHNFALAI